MPTQAPLIEVTENDRTKLESWARSRTLQRQMVERARMVLFCAASTPVKDIAENLGTYPNKVIFWRQRYQAKGIDGLFDLKRSGRKRVYPENLRKQILDLVSTTPPAGYAGWDGPSVARKLKVNVHTVWAILRKAGVHLQRQRSWCISTDPDFTTKAADIVGLYLDPPDNAIVLCVDEKPSIQALERKRGFIETDNGKVVRAYQSTYKRHGVLNLFAALDVATGHIHGKKTKAKKRDDFLSFMESIAREYSVEQEVHVILDNYSTHKRNDEWLAKHPNVKFHFTPTSASWLNQVEIFFSIMTKRSLRGSSFTSTGVLGKHIERYIKSHNSSCKPFKWRKREVVGSQLRNTIENLIN
ncbi:MAG: IS630 family transposase [Pyrinomonadaceae bacterium]